MLTTIGRYLDPWEAHIVCGRLKAEGIPATVAGDRHMIMNWPISIALGGAMLQVPEQYSDDAKQIIENYDSGVFEKELIEQFPNAVTECPACGSREITGSVPLWRRGLVVITTIFAAAPFPAKTSKIHCRNCGHDWRHENSHEA